MERFRPLEAGEFIAGIRRITIAALVVVPLSGIITMTFLGVYPWPELLYVLLEYSGVIIAVNVLVILKVASRAAHRIVAIIEQGSHLRRDADINRLLQRLPFWFFGVLILYTLQGAMSANVSLEHFHGLDFSAGYYAYSFFGTIPALLISSFPIYFYLIDYLGRYLAPRGVQVRVAPLSFKLAILGLFTPVLIDTVLLLYYFDRTGFLTQETIGLWFGLLLIAGVGSRLAWTSMRQSLYPLEQFVKRMEQEPYQAGGGPVPVSLDELGDVSRRMAVLAQENRQIESDLFHERSFVNAVLDNANALVMVLDRQGRIVRFNRACEKISGHSQAEVKGGYPWDYFLDPVEAEASRTRVLGAKAGSSEQQVGPYTNSWTTLDGSKRMIEWSNSLLLGADGTMEYMVSVGTDVSEKIRSEQELIGSYQMQRSLLRFAQKLETARSNEELYLAIHAELKQITGFSRAWLYLVDDDTRYWNLVFEPGQRVSELRVDPDFVRLNVEDDPFLKSLASCREIHVVEDMRLHPLANQEKVMATGLRTAVHVPLLVSGRLYGFIGTGTFGDEGVRKMEDSELGYLESVASQVVAACERIRYEIELARYRDHLEDQVQTRTLELKQAQAELLRRERLSTLGQLTATVSHELRNPLGSMRSSTFILRQKLQQREDSAVIRAIDRVERGIERCDHIIDELLDFTRITSLEKLRRDLDKWVASILKEQTLPRDMKVVTVYGLDGFHAEFDPHRLRRALINVMDNAVQAMTPDGAAAPVAGAELEINTRAGNNRIEIEVRDNGDGIEPEVLPRVFEPLFSTKSFGVGLGMPAVRQIMTQHNGGVDIDSTPGKGTAVILWLPMQADAGEAVSTAY